MPPSALRLAVAALLVAGLGVAGCGDGREFAPAAEPANAPPFDRRPAGRVVSLGDEPEGVATDPRTGIVAVGLRNPDRLALVSGSTGRVQRTVALSESPRHLSTAPGGRVLVPAERSDEVIEVSLPGGATRSVAVGEFPHDAVAASGRLFVGNEFGDTVTVVEDGDAVRTLDAPVQPGGLAATRAGTVVAVAVAERVVRTYEAHTLEEAGTVEAGSGPTHVVSGCDRRAFVADTDGAAMLVYELAPEPRMLDRVALAGGPYGITLDCRRRLLWVTLPGANRLVALHVPRAGGSLRELTSFPTVRQPNSVATDPRSGRVFVAGRADGKLQILEPRVGER